MIVRVRFFILTLILISEPYSLLAQVKTIEVCIFDFATQNPLNNVNIINYNNKIKNIFVTNSNGCATVEIKNLKDSIKISHIGYKTIKINPIELKNKYFLFIEEKKVKEVKIVKKKHKNFMKKLLPYFHELNHGNTAVTLLKPDSIDVNKKIKNVYFKVIKRENVKHIDTIPFQFNIYSVDTLSGKPHQKLLSKNLICKKQYGEKWAKLSIENLNIKIKEDGYFFAFIVPKKEELPYLEDVVYESYLFREVTIPNAPQLSIKRGKEFISYVKYGNYDDTEIDYEWFFEKNGYFEIKIELE